MVSIRYIRGEQYIKMSELPKIVEYITNIVRLNLAFDEQEFMSIISGEEYE